MLYREIIAVYSQIHTKHTNTLCGQNVELLNVKLAVHIVTTVMQCTVSERKSPSPSRNSSYRSLFTKIFGLLQKSELR